MLSRFPSARHRSSIASRKRFSKTSLEPKDDLTPVSLSEVQTLVKSLNTRKHRASMEAEVIGIHKPGNHDLPASYRPISLLSGLGKLSRKFSKLALAITFLGKGLIIDEQFGFPQPILVHSSPPLSRVYVSRALKPNVAP
ncbi:hypothetical protein EVAR_32728_1 [Eumeta japonica]|uniref:Uncharacterized protein n=1 Tax=Eumeta variegata TaxID=151549 RepID=A0A4C1ZD05_EUMVA|nr:hypothetical protein EVAR_32728_1 [Eumeta japonica]